MPVIKSAIKKLRKDRKRETENALLEKKVIAAIKKAKKTKSKQLITDAVSLIDKAAKNKIFHKNKASRLKSQLTKKGTVQKQTKNEPSTNKAPEQVKVTKKTKKVNKKSK